MARWYEPAPGQLEKWAEWLESRPPRVREVAERFPLWDVFRLKSSGHRVTMYSVGQNEDGSISVTVDVRAELNLVDYPRRVFGVDPEDLEPCDPPAPGEPVGVTMTEKEAREHINSMRALNGLPRMEDVN